jgi:hypothetical protein
MEFELYCMSLMNFGGAARSQVLLGDLIFLFVILECCTISVVIAWAARTALVGVGAISRG